MNLQLPATIMGVRLPDTALVRAATQMMAGAQPRHLCNHCLRAFVFGSLTMQKAGRAYDEELAFVACALHDIGLVDEFASNEIRFEVAGADVASGLMEAHAEAADRISVVWDAITLHNSVGIAERKSPEAALVLTGVGMDIAGFGLDQFEPAALQELTETLPVLGFVEAFEQLVTKRVLANPLAYLFTWAAEMVIEAGHAWPCPKAATMLRTSPLAQLDQSRNR